MIAQRDSSNKPSLGRHSFVHKLLRCKKLFFLGDRHSLTWRLFSYFAATIILIFILQSIAEVTLIRLLLRVPENVKTEMHHYADEANALLDLTDAEGNLDKKLLSEWENKQTSTLHIVDNDLEPVSGRAMHPHNKFKLQYLRPLDTILDNQVNRPLISLPLHHDLQLIVQFPYKQHPANYFNYYFAAIKFLITSILLLIFSFLLARNLQRPLQRLQIASRALAEGDFNTRVASQVGKSVTEFNQLAQDFDHMAENIHGLINKQKQLITDVSHELRTPLARHNLILYLLRKRCPEDVLELVDKLDKESLEMNNLVSEILEFSRLENAQLNTKLVPTQLDSLCQMQVMQHEATVKPKQSLEIKVTGALPMVLADSRLCLRSVKNILENAIKYAGEKAAITLEVKVVETNVEIIIADNGVGIPVLELTRIFDPFVRLNPAREKSATGYGIGLSIVKEAMNIMQGDVIAEVNSQGGLTIRLLFPIYST